MRPGYALLYSLFLVMALSLIGLGVMASGTREALIGVAVARQARLETAAEAAVLERIAGWSSRAVDSIAPGASAPAEASAGWPEATVIVTRLDTTLFLVRGEAAAPVAGDTAAPQARAMVGALVRTVQPDALLGAAPAALTASARIRAVRGQVTLSTTCAGAAPGLLAPDVDRTPAAAITGAPPVAVDSVAPLPPFFAGSIPEELPGVQVVGRLATPRPKAWLGACTPDDRSWGAIHPAHPCHRQLPLVYAPGDLRILGGEARAVIVVAGDAHITAGARIAGLLIVRGRLTIDGGSSIRGRARATTLVLDDATVTSDSCAARAALETRAVDTAFRPPERWWIPVF